MPVGSCYAKSLRLLYVPVPKNAGTSMRACLFEIENGFPYRNMILDGYTVELCDIYGRPGPFELIDPPPPSFVTKIALLRDPWRRLISTYRNRVLFYGEINPDAVAHFRVDPTLPSKPDFRTFVKHLDEYRKIPQIAHHTNAQVFFLGRNPAYYDRLFRVERLTEVEAFLSERAGRPISLPRLRKDGPELSDEETEDVRLRELIRERYAEDYLFLEKAPLSGS